MKFSELCTYFERIEQLSSRLEITAVLADLFSKLSARELQETVYLLQGRVGPLYAKEEFGLAERSVIKAVCTTLQLDRTDFMTAYKRVGDVGKTVEEYKQHILSFDQKDLSISEVFTQLSKIAHVSGDGSQEVKLDILGGLIMDADSLSARYLVRIPQGIMRLGFSDMTILDAYSWMLSGSKQHRKLIEQAYQLRPDIGYIGLTLKEKGLSGLNAVLPVLFTPIIMMRAERLSSGEDIVKQIGSCAIEPKYDGFRLQVHHSRAQGRVALFSRNLEDVSHMYPDIVEGAMHEISGSEVILEGEAVGYDPATQRYLPFQETVQRKRKYDIEEMAKKIPLRLFIFEVLYADGVSYIKEPFNKRRAKIESIITAKKGDRAVLRVAPHSIESNPIRIEEIFEETISRGLEGIIAKKLDGIYQPGARGWNWIKFKRSYSSKIHDTIDAVVMGYDVGRGKRSDFGIGAFLVGVYNNESERYETIAKIGTGLTDEEWRQIREQCDLHVVSAPPKEYSTDALMATDVWINPSIVVEIKADEITRSPVHTAGRDLSDNGGEKGTGYALRFPRLIAFRKDKRPTDSTSVSEIASLYKQQVGAIAPSAA